MKKKIPLAEITKEADRLEAENAVMRKRLAEMPEKSELIRLAIARAMKHLDPGPMPGDVADVG